jgi:hypothetical protein
MSGNYTEWRWRRTHLKISGVRPTVITNNKIFKGGYLDGLQEPYIRTFMWGYTDT